MIINVFLVFPFINLWKLMHNNMGEIQFSTFMARPKKLYYPGSATIK